MAKANKRVTSMKFQIERKINGRVPSEMKSKHRHVARYRKAAARNRRRPLAEIVCGKLDVLSAVDDAAAHRSVLRF